MVAILLTWPINSGVYYGITLNAKNLSGNFYLNLLISGLIEIPAILFVIFSISKWEVGRKKILMFTFALCAGLMGFIAAIQVEIQYIQRYILKGNPLQFFLFFRTF